MQRRTTTRTLTTFLALVLGTLALSSGSAQALDLRPTVSIPCGMGDDVIELWSDHVDYKLTGTCGHVLVTASGVEVDAPTVRTLVVRGHGNRVVSHSVDRLVVAGRDNRVSPVSVRRLRVAGRTARVHVDGLLEVTRIRSNRAVVSADRMNDMLVDGNRNRVRARKAWTLRIDGNDNRARFGRLDERTLRGHDNRVVVRRG